MRAHSLDAGIDFFVPSDFTITKVAPNNSIKIPSGIKVNIPQGWALIAFNKSGVCTTLGVIAGACVIDSGYQGEIHIHLINVSKKDVFITPDMKIMQFLLMPVSGIQTEECDLEELYEQESERSSRGFGSTGWSMAA
jgi:deoxyuridine 5'-triphosphate nucleotidohydrolase|tara:strand:+ start:1910 stop:2320 length:411 start_codon:yes stop_codon:yes gene_type:complete